MTPRSESDGSARPIRCACAITESVRELGLEIPAGLHTGECEVMDGKAGGIAVHIGAQVAKEAQPGQVLVSSTVEDLVAGSGLSFRERRSAELKESLRPGGCTPLSWPMPDGISGAQSGTLGTPRLPPTQRTVTV